MQKLAYAVGMGSKDPLAGYKLLPDPPPMSLGHQGLWQGHPALDRKTRQPVTAFFLRHETVLSRLAGNIELTDEVLRRGLASAKALARIRHPSFLRVHLPPEMDKTRKAVVLVTERVEASCSSHRRAVQSALQGAKPNTESMAPATVVDVFDMLEPKKPTASAGDDPPCPETDTVVLEVELCNVAKGIAFLHDSVQLAHLGLSPDTIVCVAPESSEAPSPATSTGAGGASGRAATSTSSTVTSSSSTPLGWKIFDLMFAVPRNALDSIPSQHVDHFVQVRTAMAKGGTSHVSPVLCPALNFAAPSYVRLNRPSVESDLWSFGCLVHWALAPHLDDESCLKFNALHDLLAYDRLVLARKRGTPTTTTTTATSFFSETSAPTPAPSAAADWFFNNPASTGAAPTATQSSNATPTPSTDTTAPEVQRDVVRLLAADPEYGTTGSPTTPSDTNKPFVSFSDFLATSTVHNQHAATVAAFPTLAVLDGPMKLRVLGSMYRLIPSLGKSTLHHIVLPALRSEAEHPARLRYVAPLVLRCVTRLPRTSIDATEPTLHKLLTTDNVHVVEILLEDFAALQRAAREAPKLHDMLFVWVGKGLANPELPDRVLAELLRRTATLIATQDANTSLIEASSVEMLSSMVAIVDRLAKAIQGGSAENERSSGTAKVLENIVAVFVTLFDALPSAGGKTLLAASRRILDPLSRTRCNLVDKAVGTLLQVAARRSPKDQLPDLLRDVGLCLLAGSAAGGSATTELVKACSEASGTVLRRLSS